MNILGHIISIGEKDLIIECEKLDKQRERYKFKFCKKGDNKELAYIEVTFLDKFTRIFDIRNFGIFKGLGYRLFVHVKKEAKKRNHKFIITEWVGTQDGLKFCKRNGFNLMTDKDYLKTGYDKESMGHEGSDYFLIL